MRLVHIGETFCRLCKNEETSIKSDGTPRWNRFKIDEDGIYDRKGKWDRESYICTKCYNHVKTIKDERYCFNCKEKSSGGYTKIYNDDGNWDGESWICNKCYGIEYSNDVIKPMRYCRNKGISKDSTLGKGVIGEAIVAKTLGLEMCSKKTNNFNFKFDLFKHEKYGNIQVKIAGPYSPYDGIKQYKFDFRHGSPCDCDTVILLLMDKKWGNVIRTYIIPSEYIETLGITISIYNDRRKSKWDEFMTDEKPYNGTYHNLAIDNCSILRNEEGV